MTHKINLDILNRARPSIEPKHLIRKVNALIRGEVVDFLSCSARSCGDILGSQFLVEPCLQGGDLLSCVFAHAALGFFEGVPGDDAGVVWHHGGRGTTTVLVARTGWLASFQVQEVFSLRWHVFYSSTKDMDEAGSWRGEVMIAGVHASRCRHGVSRGHVQIGTTNTYNAYSDHNICLHKSSQICFFIDIVVVVVVDLASRHHFWRRSTGRINHCTIRLALGMSPSSFKVSPKYSESNTFLGKFCTKLWTSIPSS